MATQIGTAFFDVSFNTVAARRELTALVSTANRSFGLLGGIAIVGATVAVGALTRATVELGQEGVEAFADYEQAFASVRKVLDDGSLSVFNTSQMFGELNQELRDMALAVPLDLEDDISAVAALGGQLGIAAPDIEEFTRVIGEVGVTSNVAVEDAATSFARLANIMGIPQSEFRALGDTLIDLGNNLPAQEDEILRFGLRIAAAGEIAGFTADEVLSIAGALSSVGVPAERGGTAIQRTLISISQAVSEGNENLSLFAQVAGLTASEFTRLWEEDAAEAFTRFVEGLGTAGNQAFSILGELELNEQRTLQALLSIANAGPLLRDSLEIGATAAGALAQESSIFFDTTQANVQLLENAAHDAAITIGEELDPSFNRLVDTLRLWIIENDVVIQQIGESLGSALEGIIPTIVNVIGFVADLIAEWSAFLDLIANRPADLFANAPDDFVHPRDFVTFFNPPQGTEPGAFGFGGEPVAVPDENGFIRAANAVQLLRDAQNELNRDLADGGPVISTVARAVADFETDLEPLNKRITAMDWRALTEGAVESEEELKAVAEAAIRLGATLPRSVTDLLGITIPEGSHPRFGGEGFGQLTPQLQLGAQADLLREFALEEAAADSAAEEFADTLEDLRGRASDLGVPLTFLLDNLGRLAPDLAPGIDQTMRAAFEMEQFRDVVNGLALSMDFDLDDVTDEFELLMTVTNKAGEEVPATVGQMLDDLRNQVARRAELEAATTALELLGFGDLAAELRTQDPNVAASAAVAFLKNVNAAAEAELLLDEGGSLGSVVTRLLEQSLLDANITDETIKMLSQLTSTDVVETVTSSATFLADTFGRALLDRINLAPDIRIPVFLIPEILGSSQGFDPSGTGAEPGDIPRPTPDPNRPGSRVPPAVTEYNFNFASPQVPTTDVARAAQIIRSI